MEKICGRCKKSVSLSLFNKRTKGKDGLSSWCRPCYSEYDRNRYRQGDRARKEANRQARFGRVCIKMWELLCDSACAHCGNDDPEVLEFDHREQSDKDFNISEMLRSYSWSRIQTEIDKCDILCANCHRKRTIKQLGSWRGTMSR